MKKIHIKGLNLQLIPSVTIILAIVSGCISSTASTPDSTLTKLPPGSTQTVKITDNQASTLPPTYKSTIQPTSTITLQPSQVVTLTPAIKPSTVLPVLVAPNELVTKMLGEVNIDRATTDLKRLTGVEPICTDTGCHTIANRMTGSEGLGWAKDYIFQELSGQGYSVEIQDWSREGYTDQNLIVRKPGAVNPEEEIYVVAHVDGVDSPAADDNASGAVDLLELARVFSKYPTGRTLVMLFSTGEEQGTLGVESYLSHLSAREISAIKDVVNIDMVSYDANQDGVMQLWDGGHAPSMVLTKMMGETIQAYQLKLTPHYITGCT